MSIRIKLISALMAVLAVNACGDPASGDDYDENQDEEIQVVPDPEPEPDPEPVYDGLVKQVQKATEGKGLDIVLMGDGFTLADLKGERYDKVMATAIDHLFSIEPVKSLRPYFNVYTVGVESEDSSLSGKSGLKCEGPNPGSQSEKLVDSYGKKVPGIALDSTVFCIIINTTKDGGWTTHQSYDTQKSYAFCPMLQSTPANQYYKLMLVHEVFGHGFAKMADEYTMAGYENRSPSSYDKSDLRVHQRKYYDLNIAMSKDKETCPWKDFLDDDRYADEKIGFYEGVGYYGKDAWRSTDVNLMNKTHGKTEAFSAPQRKIIYDRVIRRAEGRIPTYEEFVEFDKKNL